MKTIAIITATRAEYGILIPLIRAVEKEQHFKLELIVTGTHLSEKYGTTIRFIEQDGFPIAYKIPILTDDNTSYDSSIIMANTLAGFAQCFKEKRPDAVVLLGDRTELLGIASAAMNERIPIFHIHGGEVTEGAVDDCIRHAISKMSYLHFTSTEIYKKRVIQLGESPDRVFNVGALSTENILHAPLMNENSIRTSIGIPKDKKYVVVTFHPVTLEGIEAVEEQIKALCDAMEENKNYFYLITMANSDVGGDKINHSLNNYCTSHKDSILVSNLGMLRYLSAVKFAAFVLGNSSSGIVEAPVLGTPTVNIGNRQRGRFKAETIIDCCSEKNSILNAMDLAGNIEHKGTLLYGDGNTSSKMIEIMKDFLLHDKINLKKTFYDITYEIGR